MEVLFKFLNGLITKRIINIIEIKENMQICFVIFSSRLYIYICKGNFLENLKITQGVWIYYYHYNKKRYKKIILELRKIK
jgi:hypothetical protein